MKMAGKYKLTRFKILKRIIPFTQQQCIAWHTTCCEDITTKSGKILDDQRLAPKAGYKVNGSGSSATGHRKGAYLLTIKKMSSCLSVGMVMINWMTAGHCPWCCEQKKIMLLCSDSLRTEKDKPLMEWVEIDVSMGIGSKQPNDS